MVLARERFVTLLSKRNVQIGFAEKNLNGSAPTSDFEICSRAITIARNVSVDVTIGGFNNGTVSLNNHKRMAPASNVVGDKFIVFRELKIRVTERN